MKIQYAVLIFIGSAISCISAEMLEGTVTVNSLNVRIKPTVSKTSPVIDILRRNDKVQIIREEKGWYEIKIPESASVWIHGKYINGDMVSKEIKLRSGAGIDYAAYGRTAKAGTRVMIIRKTSDNWVKIKPPENLTVWVSSEFVKAPKNDKPERQSQVLAPVLDADLNPSAGKPTDDKSSWPKDGKTADLENSEGKPKSIVSDPIHNELNSGKAKEKQILPDGDKLPKKTSQNPPDKSSSNIKEGFITTVTASGVENVTHALTIKENNQDIPICYLRSTKLDFGKWGTAKVKVTGSETLVHGWKYPIVEVETVDYAY